MSSNVIKLAQPGYDVKTAGDENLIYSSLWPLLKIYLQGSASIPDVRATQTLATHDLGYPPVYWFFANTNIVSWDNLTISKDTRSEFFGPIGDGTLAVDSAKLSYTANAFPFAGGSAQLYYYIFALDLTKQYTAPIIKVGNVSGGFNSKTVFKLAKPGKDISSTDLQDYVIHSRARSPLIHSVNPSLGTVKTFTVTHSLGYLPMFFGYVKNSNGSYTMIATGQGGSSSFQSTENTIVFNDTGGKELTVVILKDPFLLDNTIPINI